ncbi:MAG: efflux RND transporter periplasmic adaptor subunit [Thermodesulfobacteriota bacterium]|nr:efflux RND transporter periplasmic adaptor subunit [Thermodesulfobacteriota bacterium]
MVTKYAPRRYLSWLANACLALLVVIAVLGCEKEERPPEIIRTVKWMKVSATGATIVRRISGVVKAVDETYLSFAVGGTVEKVSVKLGDRVRENDVLAVLDTQPFDLAVRNAEAELKKAEAQVIERRANYERISALYESNNASKAELDEARASFDSAKSQVKAGKANLGLALRDLSKTSLKAPYKGIVSLKEIEPFVEVKAGQSIFGLDGVESGFEVSVAVPENLVIRISSGQKADVYFQTLQNRVVSGVVTEVGTRSQTANTYPVMVRLDEQFSELRSGMSVEVVFEYGARSETGESIDKGFQVPVTAILAGPSDEHFVFVYNESTSMVEKRPVEGVTVHGNDVILKTGVKDGDIVVTAGVEFLNDQQKVKLMETK